MVKTYVLVLDDERADLASSGGKGASLAKLRQSGLPVPDGFHVTTAAYQDFVSANGLNEIISNSLKIVSVDDPVTLEAASTQIREGFSAGIVPANITKAISSAYIKFDDEQIFTAVRSSATAEDLPDLSFAGQQESFLNVKGEEDVLEAIKKCWASLWTARAIGYRMRNNIDQEAVSLAVVVQELIDADSAGVMFTANPSNGRRNEVLINSVFGLGETIVGGRVTPDSYVINKDDFALISRTIGEKDMMTIRVEGGTVEQAIPKDNQKIASISDTQAIALAELGTEIEALYGMTMDIEWAIENGEIAILQARPITALPEPSIDPPTEWNGPHDRTMYMRASIIEQLPDPATPLFRTIAPDQMTKSLGALVSSVMPKFNYFQEYVGFTTINDYFYMFLKLGKGIILRMYKDSIPALFGGPEGGFLKWGATYWKEEILPDYQKIIQKWKSKPISELSSVILLEGSRELLYWGTRMFTGVQLVMPIVGLSEGFFTIVYNWFIKRKNDPKASEFILGFESQPIRAEKKLYDLAMWVKRQASLKDVLLEASTATIAESFLSRKELDGISKKYWEEWTNRFKVYLDEFGYAIYNLDFYNAVAADDPRPVIETIKFYLSGKGSNPHTRQKELANRREEITEATINRLGPIRKRWFQKRLAWAQESAPFREDSLAAVGLGWPLLRRMLRELGSRLVEVGVIENRDDIFWLEERETLQFAEALDLRKGILENKIEEVENRKMIWRGQKRAIPPQILSKRKNLLTWMYKFAGPAGDLEQTGSEIKGLSIGGGVVTAPACVLHGPEDFNKMKAGDVLIADITTPAWTPLFAMASGVVTNVGGMLSHSSIVAREYGIPAVTATGVATIRIISGQMIRVNGDAGTVTLLNA